MLCEKIVTKVNNIDISGLKVNAIQINQIQKKIVMQTKKFFDTSELVKKTDCNAKITEIESKIPS